MFLNFEAHYHILHYPIVNESTYFLNGVIVVFKNASDINIYNDAKTQIEVSFTL